MNYAQHYLCCTGCSVNCSLLVVAPSNGALEATYLIWGLKLFCLGIVCPVKLSLFVVWPSNAAVVGAYCATSLLCLLKTASKIVQWLENLYILEMCYMISHVFYKCSVMFERCTHWKFAKRYLLWFCVSSFLSKIILFIKTIVKSGYNFLNSRLFLDICKNTVLLMVAFTLVAEWHRRFLSTD